MWLWHLRSFLSLVVIASALPQPTDDSVRDEEMEDPPLAVGGKAVSCPSLFQLVGDQCLYFGIIMQTDKKGAQQFCDTFQGHLVAIRKATAIRKIYLQIRNRGYEDKGFWIDGSKDGHGNWNFSNGGGNLPMGTPFWGASEEFSFPGNGTDLKCVAITNDSGFYIKDISCSNKTLSPICEVSPISEDLADENTDADEDSATEIDSSDITCPTFYVNLPGTSICTAFATWANVSWDDARQICQGLQGDLFTFIDVEWHRSLYEYLQAEVINTFSFWIGGVKNNVTWEWHDGVPIPRGPPYWGLSDKMDPVLEPDGDDIDEEDCVAMTSEGKHYLRDKNCLELYSPMCVTMPIGQ
ncbi:uncharacterized protein [Macrobrachium rosenbergii]|uniref:uncharacterized protein n=1 Tax=Macrobrachium rosenbergii TaxID=79674 RepID=UPI0034D77D57